MNTYSIPIHYRMWTVVEIQAHSLEAAINQALDNCSFYHYEYVDNSEEIDYISLKEFFNENSLTEEDKSFIIDNAIISIYFPDMNTINILKGMPSCQSLYNQLTILL